MTDIRFDRPKSAESLLVRVFAESAADCSVFDRIAQNASRAMGFDDLDRFRVDLEPVIHRAFQLFLRAPIWSSQTIRLAVLIDAASYNHTMDVVPIRQSVTQSLQHHDANPFAGRKTIRPRVEAIAFPIRRKHSGMIGDLVEPGSRL
jgi:hypothetical protein